MTRSRPVGAALAVVLLLAACGSPSGEESGGGSTPAPSATPSAPSAPSGQSPSATEQPGKEASSTSKASPKPRKPRRLQGIDVSHHQGAIDWRAVAGDGIEFAYLKATEGSGFTDSRFTTNAREARAAGLEVGGYHYYTLCAEPEPQADHFVATLEQATTSLPPVVDLELIGNCDPPPDKATLQAQVETFIAAVEEATGKRVVVYFHPDFEAHYALVEDFDRRLWVRRVGARPPPGDWFIWQRDDAGTVNGVNTPVDLDVMRRK